MAVFFNIIDVACVGALVIWLYNHPKVCAARTRLKFLMALGENLANEQIQLRLQNPRAIQRNAKQALLRLGYLKKRHQLWNENQWIPGPKCVVNFARDISIVK